MPRVTRKEWIIRTVALLLAASFLGSVVLAFFYR